MNSHPWQCGPIRLTALCQLACIGLIWSCGGATTPKPLAPLVESMPESTAPPTPSERCDALASELACRGRKITQFQTLEGQTSCSVKCLPDGAHVRVDFAAGVEERGQYIGGKAAGTWRTYREDHNLENRMVSEQTFADGQRHGPSKSWYPDGQLRTEETYFDGQVHGMSRRFGPGGEKLFEGEFNHGIATGVHTTWYPSGKPRRSEGYDDDGRPHGRWCSWRSDGTEVGCFELVHGTGTMREYSPGGRLVLEFDLVDGKKHGRWASYRNDQLEADKQYTDDELDGVAREYDAGCIEVESTWSHDVKHGPYFEQTCPAPSVKTREGTYCQGKMCGRWVERNPRGRLEVEYQFTDQGDLLSFVRYDERGDPVETQTAP